MKELVCPNFKTGGVFPTNHIKRLLLYDFNGNSQSFPGCFPPRRQTVYPSLVFNLAQSPWAKNF